MESVSHFVLRSVGRRNTLVLFVIAGVMSVLDLIGIAVIFPFLQIITQPDVGEKLLAWSGLDAAGHSLSHKHLIIVLGVGLAVFYIIKTVLQAKLMRIQFRILARFTANITNEFVSNVLNTRYSLFQQTPAPEISAIANNNTIHASIALSMLIQGFNEGLVLTLMFLGFLYFEPTLAIGAAAMAVLIILLLYRVVYLRSAQLGKAQIKVENIRYRLLFSIASAIRDIKIMGLGGLFDTRSKNVSRDHAEISWRLQFNSTLPRLMLESISLSAIVCISLTFVFLEMPQDQVGPLLGLIAISTIRAIPAMSRLFNAISSFRSSRPVVIRLMELKLRLIEQAMLRQNDNLNFKSLIELKNVSFCYGDKHVLTNIHLQLKRGETIGVVGPSGAGKSTLLDLFTGLQQATSGQFFCDNKKFDPFTSHTIQELIGYVPQTITLFDNTIAFNVSFEEQADHEQVIRALGMANLHGLIATLPNGLQTRVGENGLRLSGGQRQRLGIARALYRSPKILVLDEATSSLDNQSEMEIISEIGKLHGQVSVMIVAHRLSTVIACDRIYVLSDGAIESSGTHSQLLHSSKIYKKLYMPQHEAN